MKHADVGAGLARSLSRVSGLRVIANTSNPVLAAELAHQSAPQVILADCTRGARRRSEVISWIKRNSPSSQVVVYSASFADGEQEAFQDAGAARCLLKGQSSRELGRELRRVALESGSKLNAGTLAASRSMASTARRALPTGASNSLGSNRPKR